MTPAQEGHYLATHIGQALPAHITGQTATLEMQKGGGRWRDMEWPAFYAEYRVDQILEKPLSAQKGPCIGNITFDYQREYVWDLKVHSTNLGTKAPLNDRRATQECISNYGGLGYIVVSGPALMDINGTFKRWHDRQKGKPSAYVRANKKRGARSRTRKAAFSYSEIHVIWFGDLSDLHLAQNAGAVTGFQDDFRNSNQTPREGKFQVDLSKIPASLVVAKMAI